MWQIVKVYKDWIGYQVLNTDNIWAALEAWDNISINWNEISAVDTTYSAWTWLSLSWTTFSLNVDYWADLSLSIDPSTFVLTAQLKNQNWGNIWSAQTIDLPLESVVVSWSYNSQTKEVELTLQSGSVIRFSVADLVSWLQEELIEWNWINIDNNNEISVDTSVIATKEYVDDSIAESVSAWPTAPLNPTQWMLRYDTINDVLKSYDGTNWNEVWNESVDINTKTFRLSWTSDLTNAQAAYDWFSAWKNPIIMYNNRAYLLYSQSASQLIFQDIENSAHDQLSYTEYVWQKIIFTLSWNNVTAISYDNTSWWSWPILRTDVDYSTPYTPTYAWSPTTKKYVDDSIAESISSWATAPSNPTEWQIWYDTTNDVLKVYDGTNWTAVNTDTTYSAWTGISIDNNNEISADTSVIATKQYVDDSIDESISSWTTPPSNPTEWQLWYDTTNDVLKVYDWTNFVATWKTYTAWNHIEISNADVISTTWLQEELTAWNNITIQNECVTEDNKKWPCPSWFHVPTYNECTNLINAWITIGAWGNWWWDDFRDKMKMPYSGYRSWPNSANIVNRNYMWFVWTCDWYTIWDPRSGYCLLIWSGNLRTSWNYRQDLLNIRPFKNTWVAPDSSWTTIYDWSSTATWAWIFHNAWLGLISISTDGTTWTTIADKNLWATTVYSVWDTLSEANCGKYYQWWNNYWFQWDWNITNTSSTPIDGSSYWPNNYYYNETLVRDTTRTFYDWSTVRNDNVWWGTSQWTFQDCSLTISATWVQPWDLWTAAYCNTWTSSWNVPVLDAGWKLDTAILPWVTLTDTFTVTNASDLTWLTTAQQWDIWIVTSESKTYVLSANPYSTASNWKELLVPTSWVTSVNSKTWAVTLDADDIDDTNTTHKFVTASDITNLWNLSWTNTWDQTASDFDIKDLTDSTWLRTTWSWKQDALTEGSHIDITNNVISTTWLQEELTAWENVTIWTVCESDMRWPCPSGFHVPTVNEWNWLIDIMENTLSLSYWHLWISYLHMPMAWQRDCESGDVEQQRQEGFYATSIFDDTTPSFSGAYFLLVRAGDTVYVEEYWLPVAIGFSVRWFKNEYITPTSSWTVVQWTLWSAWIFRDQTNWLISITDWTTGYTIMDKNLWATTVWNSWDGFSEANCGKYYQWWNNYWFPRSWSITTSSTQVDASWYWPWNYYSSSTFITTSTSPFNWSSVENKNLRWWVSQWQSCDLVISAIDTTYTAWDNIDITNNTISAENVIKTDVTNDTGFRIEGSDGTFYDNTYLNSVFLGYEPSEYENQQLDLVAWLWIRNLIYTENQNTGNYEYSVLNIDNYAIDVEFDYDNWGWDDGSYTEHYTWLWEWPTWSATDKIAKIWDIQNVMSSWTTAPSNPTEWQIWYDTTNDILKVYNWTNWVTVDTDTTYTAWTWLTLNWTTFSADTTVLATKQDIADLWGFEVVASLPSVSSADTKTIYLLWPIWTGADKYEEWIVTEDSQQQKQWTKIWETSMDLSWYATTSDLSSWLSAKQDTLTASTWINIDSSNNISNTLPWPTIAAAAPTGTEWALWYDTTNDVLMAYNWTAWKEAWTQMKVLSYGHSTWQDFIDAYNENAIVYCKASSNSNPWTWTQWRMAFMAFVSVNSWTWVPTSVEFQYYRSRSDHNTDANQLDQVFVYTLTSASWWTWSVTERNTWAKAVAWTWINLAFGSGNMTISADTTVLATQTDLNSKQDTLVSWTNIKSINSNSLLGSWDITLNDVKISSTAPSSPTEWMVWYDTTNDVLKVYDGTNWNEIWWEEYTAWDWITIWSLHKDTQWPCEDWYHIPTRNELNTLLSTISTGLWLTSSAYKTYLKMPLAWYREYDWDFYNDSYAYYWTATSEDLPYNSYQLSIRETTVALEATPRTRWMNIRPFKDEAIVPDSNWTELYLSPDATWWSLRPAWIYHNATLWLISISSDGDNWITISDKNCGATQVYNNWDTLTEANCGKFYQWWNNYEFPRVWTITKSTSMVDASNYWPWNYYSSSTFIYDTDQRDSSNNHNLWWWETNWTRVGWIWNVIKNTWVLSVNWQTWDVIVDAVQLAPNSPLTPKYRRYWTQAQYEALSQYYTDTPWDTVYHTI